MISQKHFILQALFLMALTARRLNGRSLDHETHCKYQAEIEAVIKWENPCYHSGEPLRTRYRNRNIDEDERARQSWRNILSLITYFKTQLETASSAQIHPGIYEDEYARYMESEALKTLPFYRISHENTNIRSWPILAYERISNIMLHLHLFKLYAENTFRERLLPHYETTFDQGNTILCMMNKTINSIDADDHNLHGILENLRNKKLDICGPLARRHAREYVMLRDSLVILEDCETHLRSYELSLYD